MSAMDIAKIAKRLGIDTDAFKLYFELLPYGYISINAFPDITTLSSGVAFQRLEVLKKMGGILELDKKVGRLIVFPLYKVIARRLEDIQLELDSIVTSLMMKKRDIEKISRERIKRIEVSPGDIEDIMQLTTFKEHLDSFIDLIPQLSTNLSEVLSKLEAFHSRAASLKIRIRDDIQGLLADLLNNVKPLFDKTIVFLDNETKVLISELLKYNNNLKESSDKFLDSLLATRKEITEQLKALKTDLQENIDLLKGGVIDKENYLDKINKGLEGRINALYGELIKVIKEANRELLDTTKRIETKIKDQINNQLSVLKESITESYDILIEGFTSIFTKKEEDVKKYVQEVIRRIKENLNSIIEAQGEEILKDLEDKISQLREIYGATIISESLPNISRIKEQLKAVRERVEVFLNAVLSKMDDIIREQKTPDNLVNELSQTINSIITDYSKVIENSFREIDDFTLELSTKLNDIRLRSLSTMRELLLTMKGAIGKIEDRFNFKLRDLFKEVPSKVMESKLLEIINELKSLESRLIEELTRDYDIIALSYEDLKTISLDAKNRLVNKIDAQMNNLFNIQLEEMLRDIKDPEVREKISKKINELKESQLEFLRDIKNDLERSLMAIVDMAEKNSTYVLDRKIDTKSEFKNLSEEVNRRIKEKTRVLFTELLNEVSGILKKVILSVIGETEEVIKRADEEIVSHYQAFLNNLDSALSELRRMTSRVSEDLYNSFREEITDFSANVIKRITDTKNEFVKVASTTREELMRVNEIIPKELGGILSVLEESGQEDSSIKPEAISNEWTKVLDEIKEKVQKELIINDKQLGELITDLESTYLEAFRSLKEAINDLIIYKKDVVKLGVEKALSKFNELLPILIDDFDRNIKDSISNLIQSMQEKISGIKDYIIKEIRELLEEPLTELKKSRVSIISALEEVYKSVISYEVINNKLLSEIEERIKRDVHEGIINIISNVINSCERTRTKLREDIRKAYEGYSSKIIEIRTRLDELVYQEIDSSLSSMSDYLSDSKRLVEEINTTISTLESRRDSLENILNKYAAMLKEPIKTLEELADEIIKKITQAIAENMKLKTKELEDLIKAMDELANKIEFMYMTRKNYSWVVANPVYIRKYILGILSKASKRIIIGVPSELIGLIHEIIDKVKSDAKVDVFVPYGQKLAINRKNIRIHEIRGDIKFAVFIKDFNECVVVAYDRSEALVTMNPYIINFIIISMLQDKFKAKLY